MWFKVIGATKFSCLYVIVASFLSSLSLEQENDNLKQFLEFSKLHIIVQKLVDNLLPENCSRSVKDLIKLLQSQELEITINRKVSMTFQAHFFHFKSGNFLMSIPENFDPTMRQIYLASDVPASETKILYYVPCLKWYFNKFGKFCFFCKKHFTSRGCNHKCSKAICCFSCKRPFLQQDTFITRETKSFFCSTNLLPAPSQTCKICNITFFSQECYTEHKKKVCRWGWKCLKCNIYQGRNGFFKNQQEIELKHICGKRYCNFCGQIKEAFHFCCLKQHKPQPELTNLAFVVFSYSGFNVSKCKTCYNKNNGKPCPQCPQHMEKPISCIILQENDARNTFSTHILNDKTINSMPAYQKGEIFNYSYIPPFVDKSPKIAPEGRKTRFGKRQKQTKQQDIFCKPELSFMNQFFDFLMKNKFSNSTIFVYSGLSKDMFFILQGLLDNGFSPNIVKNHNQIMLIEEKKLSLRFVEVQNYLYCSFRELCDRIQKPVPYFPLQWIQSRLFTYIGNSPSLDDFFDFEDSEADLKEKQRFLSTLPAKWNFVEHYVTYLNLKIEIIATAMLEFFKESFFCQKVILNHFKYLPNTWTFLHPANPPIFTAATYSFQMFLQMSKQANVLRTINRPIPFQSSKGEIEYIMYTMWKNENLELEMAWSPYGQKNLKYTKPDAISENKIWYYNGCHYHGHSAENCKYKSKVPAEKQKEKELEFFEKIKKLKREKKDATIEIMWECVWRELKKTDKEVKFFMTNIFRNPPMSRLDPREAGKPYRQT